MNIAIVEFEIAAAYLAKVQEVLAKDRVEARGSGASPANGGPAYEATLA